MTDPIQPKPREHRKLGLFQLDARAILSCLRLPVRQSAVQRTSPHQAHVRGAVERSVLLWHWPCPNPLAALTAYISSSRMRPVSPLERLPVEILEQIVNYACTDGGQTASALALVSRRIHDISTAGRFVSVSLRSGSLCQLQLFLARFKEARAASKLRHLCLAVSPHMLTEPGYGRCFLPPGERCVEHTVVPDDDSPEPQSWVPGGQAGWEGRMKADYHAAVEELLDIVADELETLFVHGDKWRQNSDSGPYVGVFRCRRFSRLRELSFTWVLPTFRRELNVDGTDESHSVTGGQLFPELRRWHLAAGAEGLTEPFSSWVSNSPKLARMQFSLARMFRQPPHPGPFAMNFVELAKQFDGAILTRAAQHDGGHDYSERGELVLLSNCPNPTDRDVYDEGVRDLRDRIAASGISPHVVVHVDSNYRMMDKYEFCYVDHTLWSEWQARCVS
ncbi:hypothetical protein C8Q80DRAFT_1276136 [Daedaleopsis nitida]|nr:hypothetical protein C8Q80DRAFT_1276136 [Daedaleopsis nitida]